MKEVLKKILALTLAVAMVLGLAPAFEMKAEAVSSTRIDYDPSSGTSFNDFWDAAIDKLDEWDHVTIRLGGDVSSDHLKETLELENEEKLTLDLNGFRIDRDSYDEDGQIFYIQDNAELTITSSKKDDSGNIVRGVLEDAHTTDNGWNAAYGGAIYIEDEARLTLENLELKDNICAWWGGAIYADNDCVVTLKNVYLFNNYASQHGGAIYLEENAKATLIDCLVEYNHVARDGGAFWVQENAELNITGSTLIRNEASEDGSVIYALGDAKVTITDSLIGDPNPEDNNLQGNVSSLYNMSFTGAAIYTTGDADLIIHRTKIQGNDSNSGMVGAIFWESDGKCELVDVEITKNAACMTTGGVYASDWGSDICIGGRVIIDGNIHNNGKYSSREYGGTFANNIPANFYMDNSGANINSLEGYPLANDSLIGISFGEFDDEDDDCITSDDSMFEKADLSCFYYDDSANNGIIMRKVDHGEDEDENRWAIYITEPHDPANQTPAFTDSAVIAPYASTVDEVIDPVNHTITITVNKDSATSRFLRNAALSDFASFTYAYPLTQLLGEGDKHNFVEDSVTYTLMTENGTFEYWEVSIVPEGGKWDEYPDVAKVVRTGEEDKYFDYFNEAWAYALSKDGSTLVLLADWLAGDNNSNGSIDPTETAGSFGTGNGYSNGAMLVNGKLSLTVDLNGHKIDRMGGNGRVFSIDDAKLTIKDSSGNNSGKITGAKYASYGSMGGAFYLYSGAELNIEGGTITGNRADKGGAVYAWGKSTVNISGGQILENSATTGGALYLVDYSEANVSGGLIANNSATTGGGVYMDGADLYITGGDFQFNHATNGGGVYMATGTVELGGTGTVKVNEATMGAGIYANGGTVKLLSGGSIKSNLATNHGGGMFLGGNVVVNITGGTIEENTANNYGGGICMTSTDPDKSPVVNMESGYIRGNKVAGASAIGGGGVAVGNGQFNLSGGSITLNSTTGTGFGGGMAFIGVGGFTMSGGSVSNNKGEGVYWDSINTAKLYGGSIEGNDIGFKLANSPENFYLGGNIKIRSNVESNLHLEKNTSDFKHDTDHPLSFGAEIGVTLKSDQYGADNEDRITADDSNFRENDYQYFFSDKSTYRLAHRVDLGAAESDRWRLHLVMIGNSADTDELPGIEGASIKEAGYKPENIANNPYVDANRKTVIFYIDSSKPANMTAMKSMSVNTLAEFVFTTAGTTIVGGDEAYDFVTNSSRKFMIRTPNGTYDYWTIGIAPSGTWGQDPVIASVEYTENGTKTRVNYTAGIPGEGDTTVGFEAAWNFALSKPGSTLILHADWLGGDKNSNGVIDTNETADTGSFFKKGALSMSSGADVTIDLNGHDINRGLTGAHSSGSVFTIYGGKLTLTSSYPGATVTGGNVHSTGTGGGAFYVSGENSVLTINGVDISGNTANMGGAIYAENYAKVYLQRGNISNNTATNDGGAVYINGADIYISGGSIANNSAGYKGGAVCMYSGTIEISGGDIASNRATNEHGGAIYMYGGTLKMSGGNIKSNTASINGGAVYMKGGKFEFSDGYIQLNTAATGSGGGVYVTDSGYMLSTGGYIQNNQAKLYGGGVSIAEQAKDAPASILENIRISGNTAGMGGGIALRQIDSGSTRNIIRNADIYGNTAVKYDEESKGLGGGICVALYNTQHVDISGCKIMENKAAKGAGIYHDDGVLDLSSCTVTGNIASADKGGGGVYAAENEDIYIGGTTVINGNVHSGNEASNLYLSHYYGDIGILGNIGEGSNIGVTRNFENERLTLDSANLRIDDGKYFHADNSQYRIVMKENNGKYHLYIVKNVSTPGIVSAEPVLPNFKGSGAFYSIDEENRVLTLVVNNTYKDIFSAISLNDFAKITLSGEAEFKDESLLSEKQNFVENPGKTYQIIDENGYYSLWTIEVVPEGDAWSDEQGYIASVTTAYTTEYFYDYEKAYIYALENAVYPGGASLKMNADWRPVKVDDGFDYEEGTGSGRLIIDDEKINLTIDLNGFTIDRGLLGGGSAVGSGQVFKIEDGTLTIKDSSEGKTGKITGAYNSGKGGAFHMTGGHLIIEGGTISANHAQKGAAVYVEYASTLTLNGGILKGNYANSGNGGAIFLDDTAAFIMNSGVISENYAKNGHGGAIYMEDSSVFTMNGGTISKNIASNYGGNDNAFNGGGIYASDSGDGVTLTMNGGFITGNQAINGGGIYWVSDDARLYLNGGEISGNSSTTGRGGGVYADDDGVDPRVGGTIRIINNTEVSGQAVIPSNMFLESSSSNINHNSGNKLADGAVIGVRLGYTDNDDYFSSETSYFEAGSAQFFKSDDSDYIVRMSIQGTGANSCRLYLTLADDSAAANSQADIVGASVVAQYASTAAPVFSNDIANIPVNPDFYYAMSSGTLSLSDILHGKLSLSYGATIVDNKVFEQDADLTKGVNVKVRAIDGLTVRNWLVKVVPGNESGSWNSYTVTLSDAVFAAENEDGKFYPGETVSIKPIAEKADIFKQWTTVDLSAELSNAAGVTSFVMPANNVEVSAEYFTSIDTVAVTLDGAIEPNAAFPAVASYIANSTLQGVGNVSVVWKNSQGEEQSGSFGFNTVYTAEVTIDLSAEADHLFASQLKSASINGLAATVKSIADKSLTLSISYTMPRAKILEKTELYIVHNENVKTSNEAYPDKLIQELLTDLRTNHSHIPVVTEDSTITTVNVDWIRVDTYNNGSNTNEAPYIKFKGTVSSRNNPNLDFTDYSVTAQVVGEAVVQAPVISLTAEENAAGHKHALVEISCATVGAQIYYTLDGSDPADSNNSARQLYYGNDGFTAPTPAGERTTVTVKAIAVMDGLTSSNVVTASKTFNVPYTLTVTGENIESYTVSGNDGLYKGESAVVTVVPKPGYWVSSIRSTNVANNYGSVTASNSITISNIQSNVSLAVVCAEKTGSISLDGLVPTPTPGQAFPTLNVAGNGYTVTISSWNTNDKLVAYGTTYQPTVRVETVGSEYPFADTLNVTMNGATVYSSSVKANVHSFRVPVTTVKAKLLTVAAPAAISINQGDVLNLPHAVDVTTEGNLATIASVNWTCTTKDGFTSDKAGSYNFTGTLVLPENVDANGMGTVSLTVTVVALPKLPAPSASETTKDIDTIIIETDPSNPNSYISVPVTLRATVVKLASSTAGADIYYTLDGSAPAFGKDYTPVMNNGKIVAYKTVKGVDDDAKNRGDNDEDDVIVSYVYDPATGIVLDTVKTHTVKAVVHKDGYRSSDVASFTFDVKSVPRVYTLNVFNRIDNGSSLKHTLTAIEGETISFTADNISGKTFFGWTAAIDGNSQNTAPNFTSASKTISYTMPAGNVSLYARYFSNITAIKLNDVSAPVAYMPMDSSAAASADLAFDGDDADTAKDVVNWDYLPIVWTPAASSAVYGTEYTGTITLQDDMSKFAVFADNVTLSGLTGASEAKAVKNGSTLTITFKYKPEMVKMSADYKVTTDNVLTVPNGTPLNDEGEVKGVLSRLPAKLTLPTKAGMLSVDVVWACEGYTPNVEGSYTFTANLSERMAALGIDPNGHTVSAQVTVKVAPITVAMPVVDVAPGSYTEDKTVTLSCATENAKIYYEVYTNTAPGNEEPATEYKVGDTISVNGIAGQTVSVVIKAIAKLQNGKSDVATYLYTISIPEKTNTLSVVNGSGSGEYKPGTQVTVTANIPAAGMRFTGWTAEGITLTDEQKASTKLSFEMPDNAVTLTANYAVNSVTSVDIRYTAPVAGSKLPASVSYDLGFADGSFSRNNSASITWSPADAKALRGVAYSMSADINCDVALADNCVFSCNGAQTTNGLTVSADRKTVTVTASFEKLSAAYSGHVDPAPIIGTIDAGTAFSVIISEKLPTKVNVTTVDGSTTAIKVNWILPDTENDCIGDAETVTITGRLDSTELDNARITGGANATVTVYVSSLAMEKVAAPTAVPVSGGAYYDSVTISLSCTNSGATIYYTTGSTVEGTPDPTVNSTRYTAPIKLTANTTIKAIAVKSNMKDSDVATFTYTVTPTYQLTVNSGSGSGKYAEGTAVTVTAKDDVDNYFTEWTAVDAAGNTVVLTYTAATEGSEGESTPTNVVLTQKTIAFNMPNKAVTLTANYAPKVNLVNVTVPALVVGGDLPTTGLTITGGVKGGSSNTDAVEIKSISWNTSGKVNYSTLYTAKITISAEMGFAQHGDVYVNDGLVPSVMNPDGTVTLTYQALSTPDTYASHQPQSIEAIKDVPYGTDITTLEGSALPTTATITTVGGRSYTVGIKWNYAGSGYSTDKIEAYTFTLEGNVILPAGISMPEGSNAANPVVSVEISVLAKVFYDLTVNNGNGSASYQRGEGDAVTITADEVSGKRFTGWTADTDLGGIDLSAETISFAMPKGNVTLTANYAIIPVIIPTPPTQPEEPDEPTEPDVPCDGGENCPQHDFTDLKSDAWYHEAVDYVLNKGMMNGVGGGKFDPNGATSRAMIVTILWRLEGEPVLGDAGAVFSDVDEGLWYTEAVKWAAANGIVEGYDGKFNPKGDITREQVAAILFRYAKYKGIDTGVGEDTNILSFNDALSVSAWAIEAMQWAVGSGLIQGDGVNLTPAANATRCQSAALLMRFVEDIAN